MARLVDRVAENADGEFFVDSTCIDCDLCRQIAPSVFAYSDQCEQSIVRAQPLGDDSTHRALMALVSCPTASIGTLHKLDVRAAIASLPEQLEDEVYFCGFAAESSYGAASYFIRRPSGNVLIDSPRAARPLLRRLESLGGVRWLILTHSDDVGDHATFARHFRCERVLHEADIVPDTRDVEHPITGTAPIALDEDLQIVPVPGHTRGSIALLYREKFLFSGDHLWWSDQHDRPDSSRRYVWDSWTEQVRSIEKLLGYRFQWLLPGHGARHRCASSQTMHAALRRLLDEVRRAHAIG